MARSRNVKPGFFRNADLVELPMEARLLFIGIWTIADREGRLEDRPKQIKMEIFPADNLDCEALIAMLAETKMLTRYEVDGKRYIQVTNFSKHQNPHRDEKASILPDQHGNYATKKQEQDEHGASTVQPPCKEDAGTVVNGLIPDSLLLIPDSLLLIPDSLIPEPETKNVPADQKSPGKEKKAKTAVNPAVAPESETDLQAACRETWSAYADAYQGRYGVAPIRNQKVSSLVKQFVKRIGYDESPGVAAFFVRHQSSWYVQKGHDFGALLADAEKIRTEWATGQMVTTTSARQADKTQSNFNAANEAIRMIEAEQGVAA